MGLIFLISVVLNIILFFEPSIKKENGEWFIHYNVRSIFLVKKYRKTKKILI